MKHIAVTTRTANIYIKQMAFKTALCMTRQALWQQIQLSTFQMPCRWARQRKGIAASSLRFQLRSRKGRWGEEKKHPLTQI